MSGIQIKANKDIDPGQLVKKNEKLRQIFDKHKLFDKPVRVQCWKVVPDKVNRGGQPPNIHYIHENLEPNLENDGFDEMRPKPGLLKKLANPEKRKEQLDHYKKLTAGTTGLFPPLHEEQVEYSCLGGNHLTLAHRGIHCGLTSAITGKTWCTGGGKDLAKVVEIGLEYYCIDDDISDEDAKLLSEAHNSEQDQNACTGDGQNIRKVLNIFRQHQKVQKHVPVGRVIADYAAVTLVKVNTNNVAAWTKFVSCQGAGELVEEFLEFISLCVNEQEIRCPPGWLEEVAKAIPEEFGITKNNLCYIQYSGEGRIVQQRPMPDTLRFISPAELTALGANKALLEMLEEFHHWNRTHIETEIAARLGALVARQSVRLLEENVTRLAINKGLKKDSFASKATGKLDNDKIIQLRKDWFRSMLKKHSMQSLNDLPASLGIELGNEEESQPEEFLEAANFDKFKYVSSVTKELLEKGFHIGAKVNTIKRVTVWFAKSLRRDISPGAEGWIQGEVNGEPVVRIVKEIDGKQYEADVKFKVDNLVVAKLDKKSASSGSGGGVSVVAHATGVPKGVPKDMDFLISDDSENKGTLVVQKKWHMNQAKSVEETIVRHLHNKVGFSLTSTLKTLPDYNQAKLCTILSS